MKIGIFSDIHSSYPRMAAVFQDMDHHKVEKYICLGDIIGYGDRPEETVRLLMEKKVTSVRGNHELAMFKRSYLEVFPKHIKQPLIDNMAALSTKSLRYLEDTPSYLKMEQAHFVHGTPPDKLTTYIYDVSDYYLKSLFNNSDTKIFFTGHTHKLKLITYKNKVVFRRRIKQNRLIYLEDDTKYLLNVGSVSCSRDDFQESKYVIYDSDDMSVMVKMV